jgi:transcription initiation factor TFIID subunit 5
VLQRACIVRYHAHATACWSACFSPVGAYFATTGADRTVRVWAVSQRSPLRVLLGHASDATCATFHPAGAILASGGDDAAVRLWDLTGAKCLRLLVASGHAAAVRALAFSPGGNQLCSGGDDRAVLLWDLPSAAVIRRFRLHTKPVWAVGFSADGAQVVSAGPDCMVGVWDVCGLKEGAPAASAPPDTGPTGANAGNSAGNSAGGATVSAGGVDETDESDGDAQADPRLVQVMFTKYTPVVAAAYSRTNVLYVGGAFCPPEGYKERMAKQKRGRPDSKR